MPLTSAQASALADLLPDGMSCEDSRERLLCVAQVLQLLTDEDHALSNADIRAILRERFGEWCAPSENTIAADLRAIKSSGCLGLAVHTTPSGTWCERTQLTPAKVRLLLNAVQSSRFLTNEQGAELQEDLYDLVSRYQEDGLMGQVHVDQRVRKDYQQVFQTLEAVDRALRLGRKVEFTYTYSGFNGRAHPLAGDDGSTLRVETPVAVFFFDNNYYVETYAESPWRHGINLMRSRADRMVGTCVSDEPACTSRAVYDARRSARRRMAEGFDMIEGRVRRIFLRVRSDNTNVLFDRFGFGVRFAQFQGTVGEPDATGLTLVRVPQAFTFYRWLSAAGGGMVMEEPPGELGLRSGPWAKALQGVTREELLEDHRAMVEGFIAYLDRARAPYAEGSSSSNARSAS